MYVIVRMVKKEQQNFNSFTTLPTVETTESYS